MSQNERGGPIRSVYAMSDMPIGTSVPYLPVARTRERMPPRLLGSAEKTGRQGPAQTFEEDDDGIIPWAIVLGASMDVVPVTQRPSASVTEIPGVSAQPMRSYTTNVIARLTDNKHIFQEPRLAPHTQPCSPFSNSIC